MSIQTSTIDSLFLELSQFTRATTERELRLLKTLNEILNVENDPDEPAVTIMRMRLIVKEALRIEAKWQMRNENRTNENHTRTV